MKPIKISKKKAIAELQHHLPQFSPAVLAELYSRLVDSARPVCVSFEGKKTAFYDRGVEMDPPPGATKAEIEQRIDGLRDVMAESDEAMYHVYGQEIQVLQHRLEIEGDE